MLRQGMDRQRLVALKSWFNDVIYFLFDTVRVPVFCLSENRTENRFQTPVRSVNRVPVHETSKYMCTSLDETPDSIHDNLPGSYTR